MKHKLEQKMKEHSDKVALVNGGVSYTYDDLLKSSLDRLDQYTKAGIVASSTVSILGEFSFSSIASLIACIFARATVVPLTKTAQNKLGAEVALLKLDFQINTIDGNDSVDIINREEDRRAAWKDIVPNEEAGLIVFTSGSTGSPKAILHSIDALCYRYLAPKPPLTSICFLKFDHMGGVNTILSLLFRGGTAVVPASLDPEQICSEIEKYKVQLLPTTPSFLVQLLISQAAKRYDLSSLKIISYGTEVMAENNLIRLNHLLPSCKFKQTYGLSETGVFQIKSKSNDSLWFKFTDDGISYKIVEDVLWIKTKSNLLGKLVFDDGKVSIQRHTQDWFCTDDLVEVEGDYLKIKSRTTDLINVGGLKVYPSEVENCIIELDFVSDATVMAEKNIILGHMVVAHVRLTAGWENRAAEKAIKAHCRQKLERFMIPAKIIFTDNDFINDRFKKVRPS